MLMYDGKIFNNRKEVKDFVGGTSIFNRLLKLNKIKFLEKNGIAINDKREHIHN